MNRRAHKMTYTVISTGNSINGLNSVLQLSISTSITICYFHIQNGCFFIGILSNNKSIVFTQTI